MSSMKLFGNSRNAAHIAGRKKSLPEEQVEVDNTPVSSDIHGDTDSTIVFRPDTVSAELSTASDTSSSKQSNVKEHRKKKPLKTVAIILAVLLCLEGLYFFCIYSNNSFVKHYREVYIRTAMSTMRHQWLATYFIPPDVIDEVQTQYGNKVGSQVGAASTWSKPEEESNPDSSVSIEPTTKIDASRPDGTLDDPNTTEIETKPMSPEEIAAMEREAFFDLYWELDKESVDAYVEMHPDCIKNGWLNFYVNEAGLESEGTTMKSTIEEGEQVLAIDAANGILLLRVQGSGYRGVLAVGKDPSRLCIEMSDNFGIYPEKGKSGQNLGPIAEAYDGVLAMTANGFVDKDDNGNEGAGNGGFLAGYTMSNGRSYGNHFTAWAYKRIELHDDNLFYIKDATDPVDESCTDATEFQPALIIDGELLVDGYWTETNPRACIGQSDKYEILMLVIEGRRPLLGIVGTDVNTCAWILKKHHCMQAMNVDGGTSAMMWFDGEYVTLCSNPKLPVAGRPVPNAFVYKRAPIEDSSAS